MISDTELLIEKKNPEKTNRHILDRSKKRWLFMQLKYQR